MALTGAQKGIEEPGTQSSMHSGGCDPGECSSENPRMQCSQPGSTSCVPESSSTAGDQVCLARSSGSKVSWHSGTQALPLREIRFPGTRDAPRLRVFRWLHHSIYNSSLLWYKGLLWYQGAGLNFLQ